MQQAITPAARPRRRLCSCEVRLARRAHNEPPHVDAGATVKLDQPRAFPACHRPSGFVHLTIRQMDTSSHR